MTTIPSVPVQPTTSSSMLGLNDINAVRIEPMTSTLSNGGGGMNEVTAGRQEQSVGQSNIQPDEESSDGGGELMLDSLTRANPQADSPDAADLVGIIGLAGVIGASRQRIDWTNSPKNDQIRPPRSFKNSQRKLA
jgi:hypothetical protein